MKFIFSKSMCALLILSGVVCMAAYRLIGSSVDKSGILHEPFLLIPLGWLAVFLGLLVGTAYLLTVFFSDKDL